MGVSAVVRTRRNRIGGGEETGGGDNDATGSGFGGGSRHGIERGLGRRGGISGSERVKWSRMERGGRVINLDRQRDRNTAGREKEVAKPKLKEVQSLVLL